MRFNLFVAILVLQFFSSSADQAFLSKGYFKCNDSKLAGEIDVGSYIRSVKCESNYLACGLGLYVHNNQGEGKDDLSTVGIKLKCCDKFNWQVQDTQIFENPFGVQDVVEYFQSCPQGDQGDDTGLNGIKIRCGDIDGKTMQDHYILYYTTWGSWGGYITSTQNKRKRFLKEIDIKMNEDISVPDQAGITGIKVTFC